MPRGNMIDRWPPTDRSIAACRAFTIPQTINDQSRTLTILKNRALRLARRSAHSWGQLSAPPPNNPTSSDGHHIRPRPDRPRWRRLDETRSTSAGLPNPRTADVRDPPGRTVPAGFPFHHVGESGGVTSTAASQYAPLSCFRETL